MPLFEKVKKSHYETLGIEKTASDEEIKRAYFNLIRKYQPDRFPEEFKEIRSAYETLRDGKKRAEYDAIGNLPPSVAPLFHEAQRFAQFGRFDKAESLYRQILKRHPGLDTVRERYAVTLGMDDKPGKAAEEWEELCRRNPDNPWYGRELGQCYLDRGWHKKALAETRRALELDRSSIDSWSLLISCTSAQENKNSNLMKDLYALSTEALEAVKGVKTNEWDKIYLHTYAFIGCGLSKIDEARGHLREIRRLIREGGRQGEHEGRMALGELLRFIPAGGLAGCYSELKEIADLLPGLEDLYILEALETIRLNFLIEGLVKKGYPEMFQDLFRVLNADFEDDMDEDEVTAIEYFILKNRNTNYPILRRLKEEFPELYALHDSFFNRALRTRDPEKMLYQRARKINTLRRQAGFDEEDPESAPPEPVRRAEPKVGRNDPCPCGSGKKYKRCCGA